MTCHFKNQSAHKTQICPQTCLFSDQKPALAIPRQRPRSSSYGPQECDACAILGVVEAVILARGAQGDPPHTAGRRAADGRDEDHSQAECTRHLLPCLLHGQRHGS